MIRIIGIGSPFGDDAAGLEVARLLQLKPPPGCEVIAADRPGAALIDLLDGATAAILVDAARSGASPGTIHDLELGDLGRTPLGLVSSHAFGVADGVALASALGRVPARGRVLAIEAPPAFAPELDGLSPAVSAAVGRAVDLAREWVSKFNGRARERLVLTGTVQGVGMRPHVWRLAHDLHLVGFVRNAGAVVEIEVEGRPDDVGEFRARILMSAPPAASIDKVEVRTAACRGDDEFRALASTGGVGASVISPDLAMCAACRMELFDPADRRFRYPFTNCTQCGPRFTVVEAHPYDRERTTLRGFRMCADCAREYDDPANRRFRAEPIACPKCGPRAWLELLGDALCGADDKTDCVEQAAAVLRHGGVIAILGLGGAHLACDAQNEAAVTRLREIKRREHKPLAVMVDSIKTARTLAVLADCDETLLDSPSAPIVLVQRLGDAPLAPSIAPGTDQVGLMLAYTPLHYLLVRDAARPLVMTSANLPGEPLCRTAEELRLKFGASVDAILLHDRPIHQRCDDGVWMNVRGAPQPIRASRGSTPRPITVPIDVTRPILAVGGDIKNTFCLLLGNRALMSQYIGTLENAATREHFLDSLSRWKALVGIEPQLVAHDLHPSSASRALAESFGLPSVAVQHHHAHVAACLAENGETGPAIGIAFDGTGYGVDGAIWGGEALLADLASFKRIAHLEYLPLPGADAAIRHPVRIAAAYLLAQFGELPVARIGDVLGREHLRILERMIERGINTVQTSSAGRLFDAVAALVAARDVVTYEAQAAIELEALARSVGSDGCYPFGFESGVVILKPMLSAIISDLRAGVSHATIARRFHSTMVDIVGAMAKLARRETGINIVALSGGCFQNRLLLDGSIERLESAGFRVLIHRRLPANDGGLALGQAVIAAGRATGE